MKFNEATNIQKQGMDLIEPAVDIGGGFFDCRNCSYFVLLLNFSEFLSLAYY